MSHQFSLILKRLVFFLSLTLFASRGLSLDQNANGISDVYEKLYSLQGVTINPTSDRDGDGQTALQESLAGTNWLDSTSRFSAILQATPSSYVIRWTGILGKKYQLEETEDLAEWNFLAGPYLGANSLIAAEDNLDNGSYNPQKLFYRVRAIASEDQDGDGLDAYEESLLGTSDTILDFDNDGNSDVQEFLQGTDPTNPSSNNLPLIVKYIGDAQAGSPNNFLGKMLGVKVTTPGGVALGSVTVTFQVLSGGGLLTGERRNGALSSLVTATTDAEGFAVANYKQSAVTGTSSSIAAIVRSGSQNSQVTFSSSTLGPPANDLFANASFLIGNSGTTSGSNAGAAFESGEPNPRLGGASVWYRWTAPTTGFVEFLVQGNNFDTLCAVYSGSSVSSLTEIASNDDDLPADQTMTSSKLRFACVSGTNYQIAVDGFQGQNGTVTLSWNPITALANDYLSTAQNISGTTGSVTSTNFGASKESNEQPHGGDLGGASIWYKWTAPETGKITFNTAGSNFDTLLSVYTGSVMPLLIRVASNNDKVFDQDTTSEVSFVAQAGTTYRIAVDGSNGKTGNSILNWHFTGAPANNQFANAQVLSGANFSIVGNNEFATVEANEPTYNSFTPRASLWYSWTAPASGDYSLGTYGTNFYFILAGYTGTSLANLVRLQEYPSSDIYFTATQGMTYFFSINSFDESEGDFTFYCTSYSGAAPNSGTIDPQTIPGQYRDYANLQSASPAGNAQTNAADPECTEGPASPNEGEVLVYSYDDATGTNSLSQTGNIYLGVPGTGIPPNSECPAAVTIQHKIVTINTPKERDLYGKLKLTITSGDASDLTVKHSGSSYTFGTELPVVETGHVGCGRHDWHTGNETFEFTAKKAGTYVMKVAVDPDADISGDGQATKIATITLKAIKISYKAEPGATLPYGIAAKTTWSGQQAETTKQNIILTTDPAEFADQITMKVKDFEPSNNPDYTPASMGTITQDSTDKKKWVYESFDEPKTEQHPKEKWVRTYPSLNGQELCVPFKATIKPFFLWIVNTHKHSRTGGLVHQAPSETDYNDALKYVIWKYQVNMSNITSLAYATSGSMAATANAETDFSAFNGPRSCKVYKSMFGNSENYVASALGHENVHGGQYSPVGIRSFFQRNKFYKTIEAPAYKWQLDTAGRFGLSADEISGLQSNYNNAANGNSPTAGQ